MEHYNQPLEEINDFKLDNNIIRARSKIFEYSIANDFDYFITLTLNEQKHDRYDLDEFIKKFGIFIKNYRTKYNCDIQYLLIPEKHLDNAYHMHGVIRGIPQEHLFINEYGYLDWFQYKNKFGWCSIGKIRSRLATSKYLTKYITKTLGEITDRNKKLYYATRGLKQATKIQEGMLPTMIQDKIKFNYENEYVKLLELDYAELLNLQDIIDTQFNIGP